jgi:hypothetical protein
METQQMMELLLARMKKHKQDILARMEADRKKKGPSKSRRRLRRIKRNGRPHKKTSNLAKQK